MQAGKTPRSSYQMDSTLFYCRNKPCARPACLALAYMSGATYRYSEEIITELESNSEFNAAVAGIGLHYPCNVPHPEVQGTLTKP